MAGCATLASLMSALEDRIRRLEAIEAIKALKARYWYFCDHKDVEQVRACFADIISADETSLASRRASPSFAPKYSPAISAGAPVRFDFAIAAYRSRRVRGLKRDV